jgi:hypothetical protein
LPPPEERGAAGDADLPYYTAVGEGLTAEFSSLFEKAFAAWHMGTDGYLSCGLGYDHGALVIMPPMMDEYYRLGHVPKWKGEAVKLLSMNEDLASLMTDAETHLRGVSGRAEKTAKKDAEWRADMPSPAQIKLLRKLGVTPPAGITKGGASQLITHAIYVDRAASEPWSVV